MANPTHTIIAAILRHRTSIIVATVASCVFFGYFVTKIQVNNDPTTSVPAHLKARVDYESLQKVFASPRTVLLIAQFDSIALRVKIDSMSAWAKRFDALDGIDDVVHLGSIQVPIAGGLLGITSDHLVSRKKPLTDNQIRERIRDSHELTRMLISDDESTLTMIMDVDATKNQASVASQVDALQKQIGTTAPARIYVTGSALYAYFIDTSMKRDFAILLPLCLAVVFVLLWRVFKRLSQVLASLVIIAVALIWTFGLMGILRMPLSVVTSIIPVILFPIGVATAIHVFRTHARLASQGGEPLHVIEATFDELMKPILLSAITTFVGFASFSFSHTLWTRTFGIFTGVGVALALVFSIVLLPIVLWYQRGQVSGASQTAGNAAGIQRGFWHAYSGFVFNPLRWFVLVAAILAIGVVGILRVRMEGNPIAMFPAKSHIRQSDAIIEKYLGGTRFLFVLLEHKSGPLLHVEQWKQIQEIVDYTQGLDMVGGSLSLLPLINRVSMMLSDTSLSEPALAMLLKSKGLLGSRFESYVRTWLSPDGRKAKIALVCRNVTGTRFLELSQQLERHIAQRYPDFSVLVAGPPVLNDAMTYVLFYTQLSSLILAFVLVFLVLCLLFHSLTVGLCAIVPIILSTTFVYALMGFFGVAIDPVTVIIVNTCIGIGIDYSIHFVAGYLLARPNHASSEGALLATARVKGSVIMFNTFVVGIGFLVLALSSFPPIRSFGVFVFVSMVASSVFALLFLPVLLKTFSRDKKARPATAS